MTWGVRKAHDGKCYVYSYNFSTPDFVRVANILAGAFGKIIETELARIDKAKWKNPESPLRQEREALVKIIEMICRGLEEASETGDEMRDALRAAVGCVVDEHVRQEVESKVEEATRNLEASRLENERQAHRYSVAARRYEELIAADPVQRRIDAFLEKVNDVLPIERGRNGSADQAIRSRGLVLAALAGMTNVGGKAPTEPTQEATA